MIYDGSIMRDSKTKQLYLFIFDAETNMVKDGISISDHACYKDMRDDQMMVVNVSFKDGTKDVEVDLDDFIYGDKYGENNIFILIHDLLLFSVSDDENKPLILDDLVKTGSLNLSIIDIIGIAKNNLITNDE